MEHTAHIIGAIFMYVLIFGAFIAALWWRVRVRLSVHDHMQAELSSEIAPVEKSLEESGAE